jgi:DNA polymerase
MPSVALAQDTGFEVWREHARRFIAEGVPPGEVRWSVGENRFDLLPAAEASHTEQARLQVPRIFLETAKAAVLHRDPGRFALLYELLWRQVHGEKDIMRHGLDAQGRRAADMASLVRRDIVRMTSFLRFRKVDEDSGPRYVAWYEPEHFIEEAAVPFFINRFKDMRWSVLTPRRSLHWDGMRLNLGPGACKDDAPADDEIEACWLAFYESSFNPQRLNPAAMQRGMPKKYWKNLPEAASIAPLIKKSKG